MASITEKTASVIDGRLVKINQNPVSLLIPVVAIATHFSPNQFVAKPTAKPMADLQPLANPEQLTAESVRHFLNQFVCFQTLPPLSESIAEQVQRSLQFLVDESDFQTFGICADSAQASEAALNSYLSGLGYLQLTENQIEIEAPADLDSTQTPVFMKYNLRNGKCYQEPYTGTARGVLITCHGAAQDEINGTYGHFPLDLF